MSPSGASSCAGVRREFDAHDISQAVLATFFVRKLADRCNLKHPDELARLLVCHGEEQGA